MVQRQVEDFSKDAETQPSETFNKCVYYSLTADESIGTTSNAPTCIFLHGVTSDFEAFEELVNAGPDKGTGFHSGSML